MPTEHTEFPIAIEAREQTTAAITRLTHERRDSLTKQAAQAIQQAISAGEWDTSVELTPGQIGERTVAEDVAQFLRQCGYRAEVQLAPRGQPEHLDIGWEWEEARDAD